MVGEPSVSPDGFPSTAATLRCAVEGEWRDHGVIQISQRYFITRDKLKRSAQRLHSITIASYQNTPHEYMFVRLQISDGFHSYLPGILQVKVK